MLFQTQPWLFVHPTARRKSIGRELLAFALANLEGVATLNVTATNTAARNLYNQFGFITEKE
ncbi:MAG: GNAT family N-acetyltransferase, partial [Gammaproteobacteria bacterium]|nr:GNAT family N-acetyltransferase [Gammaproteobacteria bacterium]